jgi:hypothetical protein
LSLSVTLACSSLIPRDRSDIVPDDAPAGGIHEAERSLCASESLLGGSAVPPLSLLEALGRALAIFVDCGNRILRPRVTFLGLATTLAYRFAFRRCRLLSGPGTVGRGLPLEHTGIGVETRDQHRLQCANPVCSEAVTSFCGVRSFLWRMDGKARNQQGERS